jgi:hypothetical protein
MRTVVMFVGALALFSAGFLIGSQTTLLRPSADTAATIGLSSQVQASEASVTLSPLRMMIENKRSLPREEWSDLF